jgi:hypothetical protein
MTEARYLSAEDCEYEVRSTDGTHRVTGRATWSPSGRLTAVADCTCGWADHQLYGHLTREQAMWHVRHAA